MSNEYETLLEEEIKNLKQFNRMFAKDSCTLQQRRENNRELFQLQRILNERRKRSK